MIGAAQVKYSTYFFPLILVHICSSDKIERESGPELELKSCMEFCIISARKEHKFTINIQPCGEAACCV
jgi:hypothetical protein